MKLIKSLLLTTLFTSCVISLALAATPVPTTPIPPTTPPAPAAIESLPIGSAAQLRMWAAEQVTRGTASAWSATASEGKGGSFFMRPFTNGLDFIEGTNWLNRLQINLGVFNPNDRIHTFASFENDNGYSLFYGNSQDNMFYRDTGFVVRASLKIRMNDYIPIPACGVRWANILERDSGGNVFNWSNVRILSEDDGFDCEHLYFPAYFAGKKADLALYYDDGRSVVLDLQTGEARPNRNVAIQVNSSFLGAVGLRDTNAVFVAVSEDDHKSQRGTIVQLSLSQFTTVRFASWLPTGEKANVVLIREKALSEPTAILISPSVGFLDWSLPAGKYWIEFMYPSGFGHDENEYNHPPVPVGTKG